ncbi:MAG: hypothetical protein ACXQTG_05270, partial [Methanoculleaceae archaeon]
VRFLSVVMEGPPYRRAVTVAEGANEWLMGAALESAYNLSASSTIRMLKRSGWRMCDRHQAEDPSETPVVSWGRQ